MNFLSLNNRLVLEPYTSDGQVKSTTGSGFAMIQQKVKLVGLKLLMAAKVDDFGQFSVDGITMPRVISKNSIAFIREEYLHTQVWAKKLLECEGIEGKFIIVDLQHVEFIHYA
jgi:hypothetical protein